MPTDNIAHLRAVFAENTADGYLVLLRLSHESLLTPILVVNNTENVISNGLTYVAYSFAIRFPEINERGIGGIPVTIGNVDPSIGNQVELLPADDPLDATIQVVRISDPDAVLYQFNNFQMKVVRGDPLVIEGELEFRSGFDFQFPRSLFNVTDFPNLSRGF